MHISKPRTEKYKYAGEKIPDELGRPRWLMLGPLAKDQGIYEDVYETWDYVLGKSVVVKLIEKSRFSTKEAYELGVRKLNLELSAARDASPIPAIYGYQENSQFACIVFQLIDSADGPLSGRLELSEVSDLLDINQRLSVIKDIAEQILVHRKQNNYHLDIIPRNIVMFRGRAYLIDYGSGSRVRSLYTEWEKYSFVPLEKSKDFEGLDIYDQMFLTEIYSLGMLSFQILFPKSFIVNNNSYRDLKNQIRKVFKLEYGKDLDESSVEKLAAIYMGVINLQMGGRYCDPMQVVKDLREALADDI